MIVEADSDVQTTEESIETTVRTRGRRKMVEEPQLIETVAKGVDWDEKAAKLAFYEEPVTIFLHETTNPTEEQLVFVSVNGRSKWLMRGQEHTIPRCFVEVLARAKPTSIQTVETRGADGERVSQVRRHTALKYPFSIVHDANPHATAWAKELLTQRR